MEDSRMFILRVGGIGYPGPIIGARLFRIKEPDILGLGDGSSWTSQEGFGKRAGDSKTSTGTRFVVVHVIK